MAPDKAVLMGRVGISRLVGVAVMMPVVGGPPEGATLECTVAYQGEYELSSPRGGKGSMGEIAVIKSGDGKHAHGVRCESNPYSYGAPTNPENSETGQMY